MRVITNRRLVEFSQDHPDAELPLQTWRKLVESRDYHGFNDLRHTFGSVDIVDDRYIFDIRGNRYRIVTGISFPSRICHIKAVLTHCEYDKGTWK